MSAISIRTEQPYFAPDPKGVVYTRAFIRQTSAKGGMRIAEEVAAFYDISPSVLFTRNRRQPVAWARQVAMCFCLEYGMTLSTAGGLFGRDHGTALHAREKVMSVCSVYPEVDLELRNLRQRVLASMPRDPAHVNQMEFKL